MSWIVNVLRTLTLGDFDSLVKILAIVLAGIGAYYKFFKGRVHVSRLEPKISGSVVCKDGISYLLVTASVRNIGLSKVEITHDVSGFRVTSHKPMPNITAPQIVYWRDPAVFDVFVDDPWIEPGEAVEEQHLVAIPNCEAEHFAFNLELRIVSKNANWQANAIVNWDQNK
jgi:hypothetical protein